MNPYSSVDDTTAYDGPPQLSQLGAQTVDVLELLRFGWRRKIVIGCVAVVAGALAGALSYFGHRSYSAQVALMEYTSQKTPSALGALSGLSSLVGADLPGTGLTSPSAIAELVTLPEVVSPLVSASYPLCLAGDQTCRPVDSAEAATIDHWYPKYRRLGPDERRWAVEQMLERKVISASPNRDGGYASITVTTVSPTLSVGIARELTRSLQALYARLETESARDSRAFAEERLGEARQELSAAEESLLSFEMQNRQMSTPRLSLQRERLERAVDLRTELFTQLQHSLDAARLDELAGGPQLTVLQRPGVPFKADPRGTLLKAVIGAIIGALLTGSILWLRETVPK